MRNYPVSIPIIGNEEKQLVLKTVEEGWISSEGPYVKSFEAEYSKFNRVGYSSAVCNGSAAVEVALHAAGVQPGDEVIMPAFTIITCFTAIIRLGAQPVLCDIEEKYWNIDTLKIEELITNKTRAILAIHLFGHPCKMDDILEIANRYNLKVIEDCAQAHGAEYRGQLCGTFGHSSAFSFYANKLITTGEGGMVCTSDPNIHKRAEKYKNLYFNESERFHHEEIGFNFRMTSMQAAIGLGQLKRINDIIDAKIKIGQLYRKYLEEIPRLRGQCEAPWAKSIYWMYCVRLCDDPSIDAKFVTKKLSEDGIGTRPFFKGLHLQPAFKNFGLSYANHQFINTEAAYKFGFYLPSSLDLTEGDVKYICSKLRNIIE